MICDAGTGAAPPSFVPADEDPGDRPTQYAPVLSEVGPAAAAPTKAAFDDGKYRAKMMARKPKTWAMAMEVLPAALSNCLEFVLLRLQLYRAKKWTVVRKCENCTRSVILGFDGLYYLAPAGVTTWEKATGDPEERGWPLHRECPYDAASKIAALLAKAKTAAAAAAAAALAAARTAARAAAVAPVVVAAGADKIKR